VTAGPLITLTTDFGRQDPFVGIVKGVILGICRAAVLVDLTHDLPPQDVRAAALALEAAVPFFPPGTVHLAVVDPGVGGPRRPLGLAADGQLFVGPDNGLFSFLYDRPGWRAVTLSEPAYRLPEVSRTFHARDLFAPAAAHLALGVLLEDFGEPAGDPVRLPWPRPVREGDELAGEVVYADRFGNLLTNLRETDLAPLLGQGAVEVWVAGRTIQGLSTFYGERAPGEPGALIGSAGRLEIFVCRGDAARALGAGPGAAVRVRATRSSSSRGPSRRGPRPPGRSPSSRPRSPSSGTRKGSR